MGRPIERKSILGRWNRERKGIPYNGLQNKNLPNLAPLKFTALNSPLLLSSVLPPSLNLQGQEHFPDRLPTYRTPALPLEQNIISLGFADNAVCSVSKPRSTCAAQLYLQKQEEGWGWPRWFLVCYPCGRTSLSPGREGLFQSPETYVHAPCSIRGSGTGGCFLEIATALGVLRLIRQSQCTVIRTSCLLNGNAPNDKCCF